MAPTLVIKMKRENRWNRGTIPKAMNRKLISVLSLLLLCVANAFAQNAAPSLAEKLGFPADTRLLIVHADDVGMTHAVNAATITALESGLVNSASIMVPCPWFPEIADYAKAHPDIDFGLHLTLTSERVYYRWGPVASKDKLPSLVDANGYFQHDWSRDTHIDPKDAEIELHAQIDRAYASCLHANHLYSHQYPLIDNDKELFELFLRLSHAYQLPLFVTRDWF